MGSAGLKMCIHYSRSLVLAGDYDQ